GGAAKLLERGELAIVQGVGYPNPSRSHFRSMAVWHSARPDPEEQGGPGWLGRACDQRLAAGGPPGAGSPGRESAPAPPPPRPPAATPPPRRSTASTTWR